MFGVVVNLLLINLIVALVFESGFWDNLDYFINKKFRFYHIPYILTCGLCQTFWLSLLYIIITGNLSILTIALCLVNANFNKIVIAFYKFIENVFFKIIELLNKLV